MIGDLPDWITAGTAVIAVSGGLLGVYTTTQSKMDVADERLANVIEVVEVMAIEQRRQDEELYRMAEAIARGQVSMSYLKEGQDRIYSEVNGLSRMLTAR